MASRNAQDGISLIQTAEGGLNETHAILQRMRELAVQSANDTNVKVDRSEIQKEVDQLAAEITRIANNTEYNTQNLLGGKFKATFHVGANEGQNVELKINKMDSGALKVAGAEGAFFEITGTKGIGDAIAEGTYDVVKLDEGIQVTKEGDGSIAVSYALVDEDGKVYGVSEDGTAYMKLEVDSVDKINGGEVADEASLTFEDPVINGQVVVDNAGDAIAKATVTTTLANDTYTVVTDEDSAFVPTGEYGLVNSSGQLVAISEDGKSWKDVNNKLGADVLTTATELKTGGTEITVGSEGGINVSTQKSADKAITVINNAIETVSAERAKLGAMQNRLEHTIRNLDTSAENLQAAESRIRDVDMAKEMMEFTKQTILQQAATAMLAQANQMPQTVLQLLR